MQYVKVLVNLREKWDEEQRLRLCENYRLFDLSVITPTIIRALMPDEFVDGLSQDRAVVEVEKSVPLGTHYGYNI